jgi:hypothetical protein
MATPSAPTITDTVIIDHDPAWSALSSPAARVTVAAPESADSLAHFAANLAVNVAAPGALAAVATLQHHHTVWGFVASPGSDRCLPIGQLVVAEAGREVATIRSITPHTGRRRPTVLVVGGEIDPTMALWAALTREGLSVTIAWDSAQVNDLLEMVNPDALVIGAGGLPRGGIGCIDRLAGLRRPPTIVLIPGPAPERLADAFLALRPRPAEMPRASALEHILRRASAATAGLIASAPRTPGRLAA